MRPETAPADVVVFAGSRRKKHQHHRPASSAPYAFDNAKELFGKVDEEVLTVEDDEEDVEMEAEKYFANKEEKASRCSGRSCL